MNADSQPEGLRLYSTAMAAAPEEIRRWILSRRAAEERELDTVPATRRDSNASLRAALSLIALARARHGWPLPAEPHDEAEDLRAYERWARLRRLVRS
jgi:hypothetical protein